MASTDRIFPIPGIEHGNRILASVIETRALDKHTHPWVSVPINDADLSRGYKDLSFWQLNNAANHAAQWLSQQLSAEPFQCFAYAGPKDLRYPILAVAAAKLQKVMILPSPLVTPDAQMRIFEKKNCTFYLRPQAMADHVDGVLRGASNFQVITVPELDEFLKDDEATQFVYKKSWKEGEGDPWLVFHTSGTTGYPKPITYTQSMMASIDCFASLTDAEPSIIEQFALRRWYTPLPSLHFVGTFLVLSMTSFIHTTIVLGPSAPPSPEIVVNILRYGHVQGALLTPALTDELCLKPHGLEALRELKYLHYTGAPLSAKTGKQLENHVMISSAVGSSEAGPYFAAVHDHPDAWDYLVFQKHLGAKFEHRMNDLYELVFVRQPETGVQQIFKVYPELDRFPTNDLWREHPVHKGLWKIIGRADDYIYLSHADGLHASSLEPEIEAHPGIKSALIGGHGRSAPVLIVEPFPEADLNTDSGRQALIISLQPYIDKVNSRCHECVQLSNERLIFACKEKPFVRTIKGSVARLQTLALYEDEISALFI